MMQQLAPNVQLEERIVSNLLNKPEQVETVEIAGEWFQVRNLRALFLAIYLKPEVSDYVEWISIAKEEGFNGKFSDVQKLHDKYEVGLLKPLVKSLHHDYLDREFLSTDDDLKKNPSSKNKHELMHLIQQTDKLDVDKFDGDIQDTTEDIRYSLYHPQPIGIQAKDYNEFNQVFGGGMYGGCLLTIGARPSVGKTAFGVNLVNQIMQQDEDVRIDFFTLEMNKTEILNRLISTISGINSSWLRDPYHRLEAPAKKHAEKKIDRIQQSNFHVYDKTSDLDSIAATIRENASQLKPNKYICFIDYIGIIEVNDNQDRYLQLGKISRTFKNLANDYNIPIVEFTQLNRQVEQRDDKHPKLADIRESGSIEQDSNVVMFLSRNPESEEIVEKMGQNPKRKQILDVNVAKNRAGELTLNKYVFDGSKMEMDEIAK